MRVSWKYKVREFKEEEVWYIFGERKSKLIREVECNFWIYFSLLLSLIIMILCFLFNLWVVIKILFSFINLGYDKSIVDKGFYWNW